MTCKYVYHSCCQNLPVPTRYLQQITKKSISAVIQSQCKDKCLSAVSFQKIAEIRHIYLKKNQVERNKWVEQYLALNKICFGTEIFYRWHISGIEVCKNC